MAAKTADRREERRERAMARFNKLNVHDQERMLQAFENGDLSRYETEDVPAIITEANMWQRILRRQAFIALNGAPRDATYSATFLAQCWAKIHRPNQKKPDKSPDEQFTDLMQTIGTLDHEPDAEGAIVASEAGVKP